MPCIVPEGVPGDEGFFVHGGDNEFGATQTRCADGDEAHGDFCADFGGAVAGDVQDGDVVWAFFQGGKSAERLEVGSGMGGFAGHTRRGGLNAEGFGIRGIGGDAEMECARSIGCGDKGDGGEWGGGAQGQDGFIEKGKLGGVPGMVDCGKDIGRGHGVSSGAALLGVEVVCDLLPLAFAGHGEGAVHVGQACEYLPGLGTRGACGGASPGGCLRSAGGCHWVCLPLLSLVNRRLDTGI